MNTLVPLVLPKFLATDAFFVFLMVQFIRGLPRELDVAARIDGCGHLRTFVFIVWPLMLPALATTAIFTTIWMWNDFFASLIYLTGPENYTVPLVLRSYLDAEGSSGWGPMFAMSVWCRWCRCFWSSCSAIGSWSRVWPPLASADHATSGGDPAVDTDA